MLKPIWVALAIAASVAPLSRAQSAGGDAPKTNFTVFHEFGRIEKASFDNSLPLEEAWVHRSGAWVNYKATKNERLSLDLMLGGVYYTATKEQSDVGTKVRYISVAVPRFDVTYLVGDVQDPTLKVTGGIFNYKFNEYARNLGEYAFRSGVYPGWVTTGGITYVGVNSASVSGFKLNQSFGAFSHDLILSLETEVIPTYDLSLTYMAKYNWNNIVKVGGGVQFARLIPVKPSRTNPSLIRDASSGAPATNQSNRYFKYNGKWYVDWYEYYNALSDHPSSDSLDKVENDRSIAILDSARAGQIDVSYGHYNASGIKPMVTASFDPKPLFGGMGGLLGANDLVVYGEAALLGVKDYPVFYDNWKERVPVMVGFNLPVFRQLDVLAFEVEYYGSPYPDNFYQVMNSEGAPRPTIPLGLGGYSPSDWKDDNWKWSVFAQRKIVDGINISGQVARDHARAWAFPTGKTYWGIIQDKEDWYWMLKLTANI